MAPNVTPAMAVSSTPHLLTIPREMRDKIYSHLTRPKRFKRWKLFYSGDLEYEAVDVTATVPCGGVLLTCSRLHEEYRESNTYKNGCSHVILRLVTSPIDFINMERYRQAPWDDPSDPWRKPEDPALIALLQQASHI